MTQRTTSIPASVPTVPLTYPAMLLIEGMLALVVGGGPVAARKARALADAGAHVSVVALHAGSELTAMAEAGSVRLFTREWRPSDSREAALVVAASDDPQLNNAVAEHARREGRWVNVVDDPARSTFLAPAVVSRGDLTLAVSTGGASPALAALLKERLGREFEPEWAEYVALLARVRAWVKGHVQSPARRREILAGVVQTGLLERIKAGEDLTVAAALAPLVGTRAR